MNGTRTVAFQTLGCKLNQFETDALATRFRDSGYAIVEPTDEADCYIINTCTVTNKGDRKSRNAINRTIRIRDENPLPAGRNRLIVVTGCYVESAWDALKTDTRVVAVPNDKKQGIFELVEARLNGELIGPNELPRGVFDYGVQSQLFHTRAMIKIQDGCDNFCSFCIIPAVRGRATSRPVVDILQELRTLVDRGFREIVLTGVNISRYSDSHTGFSELVEQMLARPGDFRLRISSLEPDSIDDRFIALFDHPKMAPHLHLCLQSGSERILLQMRRQYTAKEYRRITDALLSRYPDFNLTTDCIVGFPGESDEDFQATCDLIRQVGFSHVHTFPYSRRRGTRAERMPGQIAEAVKKERAKRIRELGYEGKLAYRQRMAGKQQRALIEKVENGVAYGYTENYVPVAVAVEDDSNATDLQNRFLAVRLEPFDTPHTINLDSDLRMTARVSDQVPTPAS